MLTGAFVMGVKGRNEFSNFWRKGASIKFALKGQSGLLIFDRMSGFFMIKLGSFNFTCLISVKNFKAMTFFFRVMFTIFIIGNNNLPTVLSSAQSLFLLYYLWLSVLQILYSNYLPLRNHVFQSFKFKNIIIRNIMTIITTLVKQNDYLKSMSVSRTSFMPHIIAL